MTSFLFPKFGWRVMSSENYFRLSKSCCRSIGGYVRARAHILMENIDVDIANECQYYVGGCCCW